MTPADAPPRAAAGRPLWQALAVLVLVPVLAAGVLTGVSVAGSAALAASAAQAQDEVEAVAVLDDLRRSVDAELLPVLLLVVLTDPDSSRRQGLLGEGAAALLDSQPARRAQLQAASDDALHRLQRLPALRSGSPALQLDVSSTATDTANRLVAVRALATSPVPDPARVADSYQRLSNGLADAQGRATARALSGGLSPATTTALLDLERVVRLGQLASRQLPLLLASRVTTGADAEAARRGWLAAWGGYRELAGGDDAGTPDLRPRWSSLTTPSLQAAWESDLARPQVTSIGELLDAEALGGPGAALPTASLGAAALASSARDEAVADLLSTTVAQVEDSASADAAAARARAGVLVQASAAVLLLGLAAALLLGRWLARSSAQLAAVADRISRGELVEVPESGPRELRAASRALSAAVAALQHVQRQARLVVGGLHDEALALPALPGPLGRDVHAWTVQVARSAQAREQLQQQVSHQAGHDALTGLAVRGRVLADLEAALVADRAAGRRTGLLFVDLDGFKAVNDAHGHAAGDQLLQVVAARLREAVRADDVVGRLGGDEFVVVVPDAPDAEALVRRAGRLVRAVSEPVALGGYGVVVGASIGVAVTAPAVVGDPTSAPVPAPVPAAGAARTLLAEADTAAYRAKAAGRGRVELFDERLRSELTETAQTEQALRTALALGQLRVVYQPVVPLGDASGDGDGHGDGDGGARLLGVEALLRWDRPGHGPVDPTEFIAVAERSSLVRDLGCFVLAEAALQLVRWTVRGRDVPSVSVNVSGRHLADPRVVTDVLEALATAGLAPERLLLEITETVLVDDPRATANLRALRAHGVRVAIDDFGTGFTSISALATTPADQLKVGRGFVVAEAAADEALLELMARAGAAFGLEVVAEGVETAEHAERAVRAGCTGGQGWFFGPALAADELEHRLPLLTGAAASPVR